MRAILWTLVAAALLAGLSSPVDAESRQKKKQVRHHAYAAKNAAADYGSNPSRQPEYDLNKIPFGSRLWWEQSERERGGSTGGGGGGGGTGF